ncbi:FAD/NAD(P)-binding protein [Haematobacter massiliensis]|uniref:FAD/NAD(P)-binding protein n=1 Tax=Haematobacter massiliensis TaxID=195105 RepID=UPI00068D5A93|nr:FAD/NAD(P)-binding protein [Haematobacter massiliensis]
MTEPHHILIIGGGASGTILAAHLLRNGPPGLRLTLVERRERLGRGIAYDTPHAAHLLNTRVGAMSAFADRPDHFHDWLAAQGTPGDRDAFVPRHLYAAYLESLVSSAARLRREQEECISLTHGSNGRIAAHLADGRMILADRAVLATGHPLLQAGTDMLERAEFDPWHAPLPESPEARVLIVGTGLTMVDRVMRLLEAGHRGEIVILSRRGLLPRVNGPSRPIELDRADLPLGAGAGYALRWLRKQVRWHEGRGGDWRDIVDGARGHLALWWQSVPPETRGRFLRHARRFWEIHRHRIPAPVAARLDTARLAGQVRLVTGTLLSAAEREGRHSVTLRHRGGELETVEVTQITDGRGLLRDPEDHATPLVRSLVDGGMARIDALRIGLEVTAEGQVLPRPGTPAAPLHAIGPAARAASWEGLAIVDIRAQAALLVSRLISGDATTVEARRRPCG